MNSNPPLEWPTLYFLSEGHELNHISFKIDREADWVKTPIHMPRIPIQPRPAVPHQRLYHPNRRNTALPISLSLLLFILNVIQKAGHEKFLLLLAPQLPVMEPC